VSRFVVTGVAGFVGSRCAELLLDQGHTVIGIDAFIDVLYPNELKHARVAKLGNHANFKLLNLDLRFADLDSALADADAVLHFAALAGLATSWQHPELYHEHNVLATQRLIAAAEKSQTYLVYISTSSVYGSYASGDETRALEPVSPYGRTKLAAEQLVEQANISSCILRLFSVYGPGQRPEMAYAKAISAALNQETFTIFGDGTQLRTNTYVDDVAQAAILAATLKPAFTIMNICGQEPIELNQALNRIEELAKATIQRQHLPNAKGDQVETNGDPSKAAQILGWSAKVKFDEGIRKQIEASRK
jgi:nucleoside-diphosphate-sugar epimerase